MYMHIYIYYIGKIMVDCSYKYIGCLLINMTGSQIKVLFYWHLHSFLMKIMNNEHS